MRIGIILLFPVLGILNACTNSKAKTENKIPNIPVTTVFQGNVSLERLYVADIQAVRNVEIRSRIPGFVEAIFIDEGKPVKKGQLLFKIADQEYIVEVSKAKAVLNNVIAEAKSIELELERVRLLVAKKILAQIEADLAESKLKAAKAKVEEARSVLANAEHRLSYTKIRAPFDGVIDRIPLKAGSLLHEGTLISSVSDISSVYTYFNISENEYLDYRKTMPRNTDFEYKTAKLILANGVAYEFPGKIETVVSEFNENTGSIAFRAIFPNAQKLLKHGASGKIMLTSEHDSILLIPQKAVFEIQDKNYVFVLDASNKVYMKDFKPQARYKSYYLIHSGLRKGDKIVLEGHQNIKEGMVVNPLHVIQDSTELRGLM